MIIVSIFNSVYDVMLESGEAPRSLGGKERAGVFGNSMDTSGPVRAVDTESALGPADEAGEILSTHPLLRLRGCQITVLWSMR